MNNHLGSCRVFLTYGGWLRNPYHLFIGFLQYWIILLCSLPDTVDGCEILHQLIDGKHPIIRRP